MDEDKKMKSSIEIRKDLMNELRSVQGLTTLQICEVMNAEKAEVELALNYGNIEGMHGF